MPNPQNFKALLQSLRKKLEVFEHVLLCEPWQLFAAMLSEFDMAMHFHYQRQGRLFAEIDAFLSRVWPKIDDGDVLLSLVSDHGSTPVQWDFDPMRWLEVFAPWAVDKVQVDGWGNIWCDDAEQKQTLRGQLLAFTHKGVRILDVWDGKVIWEKTEDAPDLVVWPKRELGYSLQPRAGYVLGPAQKQGCHTSDGIVSFWGKGIETVKVYGQAEDYAHAVLSLMGKEIPAAIAGKTFLPF